MYRDSDRRLVRRYKDSSGQKTQLLEDVHLKDGSAVTRVAVHQRLFIPQNLADLAWAFSDRGHKDERLFRLIAIRHVELSSTC